MLGADPSDGPRLVCLEDPFEASVSLLLCSSARRVRSRIMAVASDMATEEPETMKAVRIMRAEGPQPISPAKFSPTAKEIYIQIKKYETTKPQEEARTKE